MVVTEDLVPPEHLIKLIGGKTADDYKQIGERFFDIFVKWGGVKPTDRVLDVGCGCGRMAMPLTKYLTSGSYEGFDVVGKLIDWCRDYITPRFPAFRFQRVNVYNAEYNRKWWLKSKPFQFPYPDAHFDFIFLTSVFTHMLQKDLDQYAREIARTLKPSGTALITFFVLNEESERLGKTPGCKVSLPYAWESEGIRVADKSRPGAVVAYPEAMMRRMLSENGLALQEPIHFGSWCGRTGTVTFQDVTISKKK